MLRIQEDILIIERTRERKLILSVAQIIIGPTITREETNIIILVSHKDCRGTFFTKSIK